MIIEAIKCGIRKSLRHYDRRRAMAAADVRDFAARFEFFFDPCKGQVSRIGDKMGGIAGSKNFSVPMKRSGS